MPIIIKNIVQAQTICIQGTPVEVPAGSSLTMKDGQVWLNGKIVPPRGNSESRETPVTISNLSGNVDHIGLTDDKESM